MKKEILHYTNNKGEEIAALTNEYEEDIYLRNAATGETHLINSKAPIEDLIEDIDGSKPIVFKAEEYKENIFEYLDYVKEDRPDLIKKMAGADIQSPNGNSQVKKWSPTTKTKPSDKTNANDLER